jgi:hypothetical protein
MPSLAQFFAGDSAFQGILVRYHWYMGAVMPKDLLENGRRLKNVSWDM